MITSANALLLDERAWLRAALQHARQTAPGSTEIRINGYAVTRDLPPAGDSRDSFEIKTLTAQADPYLNMVSVGSESVLGLLTP